MRNRFILIAAAAFLAPAAVLADPAVLEFRGAGICNASAAVALDERRLLVGDDEKRWLSMFDMTDRSLIQQIGFDFPGLTGEADVEGATVLQDQVIWITSHGRDGHGAKQASRQMLFASH